MKKTFKILLKGLLIMAIANSIGCKTTSQNEKSSAGKSSGTENTNLSKLTEMQALMAQKAVKMQSENNPIAYHKFSADPAVFVDDDGNGYLYFGGGNNHHWIFEFKGKHYIAFHAPTVEKQVGLEKTGYRSLFLADFLINEDGSLPVQNATKAGVSQAVKFNPYEKIPASTMHSSSGIGITKNQTTVNIRDNAYIFIKGVDCSKGTEKITFNCSEDSFGTIKVMSGNWSNGEELASAKIDGSITEAKITLPQNACDNINLFLVFDGNIELHSWEIQN